MSSARLAYKTAFHVQSSFIPKSFSTHNAIFTLSSFQKRSIPLTFPEAMALSAFLNSPFGPAYLITAENDSSPYASKQAQQPAPVAFAPVDVQETEDAYAFLVDVPGMNKEGVKVNLEQQGRVLSISGERQQEPKLPGLKYHRMERTRGKFERKFRLPKDANGENIKAAVKDGVLSVHIVKRKAEEPKVINVEVQAS